MSNYILLGISWLLLGVLGSAIGKREIDRTFNSKEELADKIFYSVMALGGAGNLVSVLIWKYTHNIGMKRYV